MFLPGRRGTSAVEYMYDIKFYFKDFSLNTINPIIQVVAYLDSERHRVGFMPITGGSLDVLSEPVTHSVITGSTIPSAELSFLSVVDGLRDAGYAGADFVLVGWDARDILSAIKRPLPVSAV